MSKKASIYRFRTIIEQDDWELRHRLEEGKTIEEINRFEYMCRMVKIYPVGIYRFKTIDEKRRDEFERVMKAWEKLNSEKHR